MKKHVQSLTMKRYWVKVVHMDNTMVENAAMYTPTFSEIGVPHFGKELVQ